MPISYTKFLILMMVIKAAPDWCTTRYAACIASRMAPGPLLDAPSLPGVETVVFANNNHYPTGIKLANSSCQISMCHLMSPYLNQLFMVNSC